MAGDRLRSKVKDTSTRVGALAIEDTRQSVISTDKQKVNQMIVHPSHGQTATREQMNAFALMEKIPMHFTGVSK